MTQPGQAAEALRQSGSFLQRIIDSVPDHIMIIGRDYRVSLANRAVREATGCADPAAAGLRCHQASHGSELPCDGQEHPCPLQEVVETRRAVEVEHTHYDSEGHEIIVEIRAAPVFDEAGEVVQVIETARDITERKRAEEEIQSLARFPSENPHPVLRIARDGTVLYANAPAEPLLKEQGSGVGGAAPEEWREPIAQALESGLTGAFELVWGRRTFSFRLAPVGDAGYVNWYGRDITERRRAEEELRAHREHLQELVAERTAALATTNEQLRGEIAERRRAEGRASRQAAVLQAINDVFRWALTTETEEELGKTCLAVAERLTGSRFGFLGELNEAGLLENIAISDPGWDACKMAVSDARKSIQNMRIRGIDRGTIREGKSRIVNADEMATHPDRVGTPEGHPQVTAFLGVPLKHEGKTIGMIGLGNKETGYDAADQEAIESLAVAVVEVLRTKRAEVALREARAELVRATRLAAIGQVSASIAHDLRNPLGTVRNATYYLRRRLGDEPAEVKEYLGIIDEEIEAADRIIGNLLAMARAREPVKQSVDLGRAVTAALDGAEHADAVQLRMSLSPDPFIVRADPDQLRQIVRNLVTNAVQAMGGGGELLVEAARDAHGDAIVFRDTGPGVAAEVEESLFEPLVTTRTTGTGLGLTICRQIAELHGGSIELIDRGRPGAAFRIRLPRE